MVLVGGYLFFKVFIAFQNLNHLIYVPRQGSLITCGTLHL